MLKKNFILFCLIQCFLSCSNIAKNDDIFFKFVARERHMKDREPTRIFNPGPAVLISTLPEKIGNLDSIAEIIDYEIINNGLGYSKRYKNKSIKSGYWLDIFAYHAKQPSISNNIDDEISKGVYENSKIDILNSYKHSKPIEENILIFTSPNGKILKMREVIFEYWNPIEKMTIKSYMYFGTSLDSFYKIRISYDLKLEDKIYMDKEKFIKEIGYYYIEDMSLKDFNLFKKSNIINPVKIQRLKNI